MPTIISHSAVTLALGTWPRKVPARVLVAAAIGTMLPDADVVAFAAGIPYGATFGHRGFTHSIVFAVLASLVLAFLIRRPRWFPFLFVSTMSHAVLDAMTNGGRGIAFFSPFSNRRYFFPWRPIEVSPIGALDFGVLLCELKWIWAPAIVVAAIGWMVRAVRHKSKPSVS